MVTAPPPSPGPSRFSLLSQSLPALLWVVSLAVLANLNVLNNGVALDDESIIQNLTAPSTWRDLLLPSPAAPYYRPLISLSYLLDYKIWGRNPFGFHLSVLIGHAINTALVFLLSRRLFLARGAGDFTQPTLNRLSLVIASLFAVHPVHAEAVAWIAGRNDVFCTTFILSSILLYIRFRQTGKEWVFGLSMLFFFFALLTKEMAAGLVLLFPLYDYLSEPLKSSHSRWPIGIRFLIPLGTLGVYFFLRTAYITHPLGGLSSQGSPPMFWNGIRAAGLYLKLTFFPYPYYPFIASLPQSTFFLFLSSLCLILLIIGGIWALLRCHLLIGWGLAWALVLLTPAIPIVSLEGVAAPVAERYLYAPSIGFLIVISGLILSGIERLRIRLEQTARSAWIPAALLWAALVLIFGLESWNRNVVWKSPLTFWKAAVEALPENGPQKALAHNNLGLAYYKERTHPQDAVKEYQNALKLKSDYLDAHINLGNIYKDLGRLDEAVREYLMAIKLKSDDAAVHTNMGNTYKDLGRLDEAVREFQTAIKLKPDDAITHTNLGNTYKDLGHVNEAVLEYQTAIKLNPDYAPAHTNLGVVYNNLGHSEEAIQQYQTALRLKPNLVEAHNNLGVIYKDLGRLDDAIQEFQSALQLRQNSAVIYFNLGDAYHRKGQTKEAVGAFERALQIKPDFLPARKALESLPKQK